MFVMMTMTMTMIMVVVVFPTSVKDLKLLYLSSPSFFCLDHFSHATPKDLIKCTEFKIRGSQQENGTFLTKFRHMIMLWINVCFFCPNTWHKFPPSFQSWMKQHDSNMHRSSAIKPSYFTRSPIVRLTSPAWFSGDPFHTGSRRPV